MLYHLIIKPIVRFFTRLFGYSTVEDLVDDNVNLNRATNLVVVLGLAGTVLGFVLLATSCKSEIQCSDLHQPGTCQVVR